MDILWGIDLRQVRLLGVLALVLGAGVSTARQQGSATVEGYEPAALLTSRVPPTPARAGAGGEVLLEVVVDETGSVTDVIPLTDAPPFTDAVTRVVRGWRFKPAQDEEGPLTSRVVVAAVYRDPAFYTGTTIGEPTRFLSEGSSAIPYPELRVPPPYPPGAYDEGTTLLAVAVEPSGDVAEVELLTSTPGFVETSLDTVRRWRFRPAIRDGQPVPSMAYVIFDYRQPVVP